MLNDVILEVSGDTGLHVIQKRNVLIALLNKAAKEMYNELECNKINREVTLIVPPDKVISLPSFIGELRGMRTHSNEIPFPVNAISQPRYVSTTFGYRYKNWRDKAESPVHTYPSDFAPLTIVANGVEVNPVTVVINGQTNLAQKIEEVVPITTVSSPTTNLFGNPIYSISCLDRDRIYDIVIQDHLGNEIATLYNIDTNTRYKIVDVSQMFWPIDTSQNESIVDVMYKVKRTKLTKDTDQFYAGDDFDEAWYNMSMYMFLKPIQNRQQEAMMFRAACMDFLQSAKESGEGNIEKKLTFGRNKYYNLIRPWRRIYPGALNNVDVTPSP